jgi:hypothetical protein
VVGQAARGAEYLPVTPVMAEKSLLQKYYSHLLRLLGRLAVGLNELTHDHETGTFLGYGTARSGKTTSGKR